MSEITSEVDSLAETAEETKRTMLKLLSSQSGNVYTQVCTDWGVATKGSYFEGNRLD